MLRRILAMGLIIALISASFSRFFAYAGFEANRGYISKVLCENRNRPWLHCNGKCYFMKKIKQAEENEKKHAAKDNLNRLEVSFFEQPFLFTIASPTHLDIVRDSSPVYTYQYSSRYLNTIFRPPKQIA
jgi:hypothetical protein